MGEYPFSPVARAGDNPSPIAAFGFILAFAGVTGTRWFNLTGGTLHMSMKRNILLAATAMVALAATPVLAQKSLAVADVDTAGNGVETSPFFLANQISLTPISGQNSGFIEMNLVPTVANAAAYGPGQTLTLSITGGEFNAPGNTNWLIAGNAACILGGLAVSSTSATTVQITGDYTGCGLATGHLRFKVPVRLTGLTSVNMQVGLRVTATNLPVDGAEFSPVITPIRFADAARFVLTASNPVTANTTAQVATQFRSFTSPVTTPTTSALLGTAQIVPDFAVSVAAGTTALPAGNYFVHKVMNSAAASRVVGADVGGATLSVTTSAGAFAGLGSVNVLATGGTPTNVASTNAGSVATLSLNATQAAGILTARDVTVSDSTTPDVAISAQSFTVGGGITFAPAATLTPITSAAVAGTLTPITRNGSSVFVPWVASGTLSQTSTSVNSIRFTNSSTVDAPIFFTLPVSSTISPPPTTVYNAGVIPARGELLLSSAALETIVGANFGRADVSFTIEAPAGVVTARQAVVRPDGVFQGAITGVGVNTGGGTVGFQ